MGESLLDRFKAQAPRSVRVAVVVGIPWFLLVAFVANEMGWPYRYSWRAEHWWRFLAVALGPPLSIPLIGSLWHWAMAPPSDHRRRQHVADEIERSMPIVQKAISEKWKFYCKSLPFAASVPLAEQISSFVPLILHYLRNHHPAYLEGPAQIIPQTILIALLAARTHDPDETHEACRKIWPFIQPAPPKSVLRPS